MRFALLLAALLVFVGTALSQCAAANIEQSPINDRRAVVKNLTDSSYDSQDSYDVDTSDEEASDDKSYDTDADDDDDQEEVSEEVQDGPGTKGIYNPVIVDANEYMDLLDRVFIEDLDSVRPISVQRRKRAVPLILLGVAARALFAGAAKTYLKRSGVRLTQQYAKSGNYFTGLRDFSRVKPFLNNVKPIQSGSTRGYTGSLGKYRVTVRNQSSSGAPTLEIRGGNVVRKFRYSQK